MAKLDPVAAGLERYFAHGYAVDHHPGDPDSIVRVHTITERAVTEVPERGWTPELLDHIRRWRRP